MPKLTEYPEAQSFDENDILIKDGVNGTKKIKASNAADYMGKNVIMVNEDPTPGTKVVLETTDEEYELALMSDVDSVAEEVADVKTQLNDTFSEIAEYKYSKNRWNGIYTAGKFVNQVTGAIQDVTANSLSDWIDISNRSTNIIVLSKSSAYGDFANLRYFFYDKEKTPIASSGGINPTLNTNTQLSRDYTTLTAPDNAYYMLFSNASNNFINVDSQYQVEYDSLTAYSAYTGDSVEIKPSALTAITDGVLNYDKGENLIDMATVLDDTFMQSNTGNTFPNYTTYKTTDFIPIDGDYLVLSLASANAMGYSNCYFDVNKNYLAPAPFPTEDRELALYYGVDRTITRVQPVGGAKYIRICALNAFFDASPALYNGYAQRGAKKYSKAALKLDKDALDKRYLSALNEASGGVYNNCFVSGSLNNAAPWKLGVECSAIGNETLSLFATFTTLGEIRMGLRGTTYEFIINDTKYGYSSNGVDGNMYDHDLTIKDYIAISIVKEANGGTAHVRVTTNGGMKTFDNVSFTGTRGRPTITVSASSVITYATASYISKSARPIWAFGDSYFSAYSPSRWPYYLIDWNVDGNILLNGYPGQNAQTGIEDFEHLLSISTPRYAVWCLGMNNPDADSAVNSDWMTAVNKFIDLCEANNIEPIFATIPNVPSISHIYKNAWIRSSGYRYVEFAKAVGADEQGSGWFDGMLAPAPDLTHPTALGAIALASQFVAQVPELMYK